ncbi:hypothetical protein DFJ73DRAFT_390765 [Zopfochytrium polystomum]|nr:hypothetical protein DFJ73DRAFT_390765 [Zopfochytrium polystomum]
MMADDDHRLLPKAAEAALSSSPPSPPPYAVAAAAAAAGAGDEIEMSTFPGSFRMASGAVTPWYKTRRFAIAAALFVVVLCGAVVAIVLTRTTSAVNPVELIKVYALNHSSEFNSFFTDLDGSNVYQALDSVLRDKNNLSTIILQGFAVNKVSVPVTNTSFAPARTAVRACATFGGLTSFIVGDLYVTWFSEIRGLGQGNARMAVCNMSVALTDAARSPPRYIELPSFPNGTYEVIAAMRPDATSTNITIFSVSVNHPKLMQFTLQSDSFTLTMVDSFALSLPGGGNPSEFSILLPPAGSVSSTSNHVVSVISYSSSTYDFGIETFAFIPGTGQASANSTASSYQSLVGSVALNSEFPLLALAPPYIYACFDASRGILALPLSPYSANSPTPPAAANVSNFTPVAPLDHAPPAPTRSGATITDARIWVDHAAQHLLAVYRGDGLYLRAAVFEMPATTSEALVLKWNGEIDRSSFGEAWTGVFGSGTNVWALASYFDTAPFLLSVNYDS